MKTFRFPSPEEKRIEELELENSNLLLKNALIEKLLADTQADVADLMFKVASNGLGETSSV